MDSEITQRVAIVNNETAKVAITTDKFSIKTEKGLKAATERLAQIKALSKNVREAKESVIKPLLLATKNARELFAAPEGKLKHSETLIKSAIVKYHDRVAAKALKEAEKIESQVESGDMDVSTGMAELSSVKQAENKVTTEAGSATIRKVKKIKIVDPSKLPKYYLLRPKVIEALRIEVSHDVLRGGKKLPAGAEEYEEKNVASSF